MSQNLKSMIDRYRTVTVLSHINPDADAIGTSLGVYALLKAYGKQVEIVNYSTDLPQHLDFLPGFSRIKHKIDYAESLIIACDCGSIDRLGFDLEGREIINIDHHQSNQNYGTLNLVDPFLAASSHVAYRIMEDHFPVTGEAATCFYTALLSDTRYFTTANVDKEVFDFAAQLMAHGADHKNITFNMTQRRSLASLRILGKILDTLELHCNATVASMKADRNMIMATGAKMSDMDGIVDYARSLATVEIGIFLVEEEQQIKVSLRSKNRDIAPLAEYFGGGGHRNACGFVANSLNLDEVLDKILAKIEELGWEVC
ncbi:MAG: bifunctional oligoribonuclease/PAP phosphatase NrnA [Campylobacterota bacterium]|nr:bifunctional oligoribonuclease/PAP phosphatase NrnA [Campylobacterota bacterium]